MSVREERKIHSNHRVLHLNHTMLGMFMITAQVSTKLQQERRQNLGRSPADLKVESVHNPEVGGWPESCVLWRMAQMLMNGLSSCNRCSICWI